MTAQLESRECSAWFSEIRWRNSLEMQATAYDFSFICQLLTLLFQFSGFQSELYMLNPKTVSWMVVIASGTSPLPRYGVGFTAVPSGKIYSFGGYAMDHGENKKSLGHLKN
jgi:hypothetical protein